MSAREIAIALLLNDAPVTAVVGQRIWPSVAEQRSAMPYILVHKPSQLNRQLVEGDAAWAQSRVSFECIAASAAAADALGDLLYQAFKDVTERTVEYRTVTMRPADLDVDDFSDDRSAYRRIVDFYVDWKG